MTRKNKNSVILLAIIPVIGSIIVAYINGCFSNKNVVKKITLIKDTIPEKTNNQFNNNNATQYNSNGDIIINQNQNSNKPKKQEKEKSSPQVKIEDNKGIVNIGGENNIYNQTINPKPEPRHFTNDDLNKINALNPPRNYEVSVIFSATVEAETYAREIAGLFEQNGFKIRLARFHMIIDEPEPRFKIKIDDETKTIEITVLKQE